MEQPFNGYYHGKVHANRPALSRQNIPVLHDESKMWTAFKSSYCYNPLFLAISNDWSLAGATFFYGNMQKPVHMCSVVFDDKLSNTFDNVIPGLRSD